jgi:transcriptional regulator GlxA family with amidase domain
LCAGGITIYEYVVQMRISHAQRLLATTDREVTDIAMDCGFASLNRFYETFGRLVKMAPAAYRKAHHLAGQRQRLTT